jgi:hypothetical protein
MQVAPAVSQPRFPSALPDQSFDELLIDLEEDRAARAVAFGLLARDALSVLRPKSNLRVSSSGLDGITVSFLRAARRASQGWPISRAVMFAS